MRGFVNVAISIAALGLLVGVGIYASFYPSGTPPIGGEMMESTKAVGIELKQPVTKTIDNTRPKAYVPQAEAPAKSPERVPVIRQDSYTQTVKISRSGKYTMRLPTKWIVTKRLEGQGGEIPYDVLHVFNEEGAVVMKIRFPVREIGYESMQALPETTLQTGIGMLQSRIRIEPSTVIGEQSIDMASGHAHYWWPGNDYWNESFEVFVLFGSQPLYPNATDRVLGEGVPLQAKNLGEFKKEKAFVENILGTIRQ